MKKMLVVLYCLLFIIYPVLSDAGPLIFNGGGGSGGAATNISNAVGNNVSLGGTTYMGATAGSSVASMTTFTSGSGGSLRRFYNILMGAANYTFGGDIPSGYGGGITIPTGDYIQDAAGNFFLSSTGLYMTSGSINIGGVILSGSGTVTSVNAANNTPGITISGGPITSAGTLQIGVSSNLQLWNAFAPSVLNCGVNAINSVANNGTVTCVAPGAGGGGTVTSVNAANNTPGITISGGPITSAGTLQIGVSSNLQLWNAFAPSVLNCGVNAINSVANNGTVTCVAPGAGGGGTVTSVNAANNTPGITISGGPITSVGTLQIGVSNNLQLWNAFTPSVLNCGVNAINSVANNGTVTCVAPGTGGGGTVTSINAANNTPGITVSGSPITSAGTLQIGVSSDLQLWSAFAPSVLNCGTNAINSVANNGALTCVATGNLPAGSVNVTLAPNAVLITDSGNNISFSTTLPANLIIPTPQINGGTVNGSVITKRFNSAANAASLAVNCATTDIYALTALASALTISAPTGCTPVEGQAVLIRITDNGTSRALTYSGMDYGGLSLPSATTVSKTLYIGVLYNSSLSEWLILGFSNGY